MLGQNFPFRIMVVEDDAGWFELMQKACIRARLECVVVESQAEAKQSAARARHHLISIDQHIPESRENPTMSVAHGIDLTKLFSQQYPMSTLTVLTARSEGETGLQIALGAGTSHADFWRKSVDGVDRPNANPPIVSQHGFPAAARKKLDDVDAPYRRQYFDAAPHVLPAPLASAAANLGTRLKPRTDLRHDASAPLHLFSFWELTLELTHAS